LSLITSDLTWRFELCLPDPERWVPVTTDMVNDEYAEHVGTKEMVDIWQDADEAAPSELDQVLPDLVDTGDPFGMTGARIVVWEGVGDDGAPACVLEATADQLAAARLEHANRQVQTALHEVDVARTQVRAQIIKAATENRLGRNTIARLVNGALTRRLVLQLLAGYDLIEAVRDALPSRTGRYRRWYQHPVPEPEDHYLGPFCYGPIRLDLEPSGQVHLRLVDVDGPRESDIPAPTEHDNEGTEHAYRQALTERARGYAEEVLPVLTEAGFALHRSDGTPASVDDLAQAMTGPGLLVSDDN
jgi:hypothetical protein